MLFGQPICRHLTLAVALLSFARGSFSQQAPGTVDPRPYGIDLPAGPVVQGYGERVTTDDNAGQPVVGRLHVRIGEGAVVLLPDGQLVARARGRFEKTDRPFNALSQKEIASRLEAEFPGFNTNSTNHYVYVYNTSDEFQLGTSRILETLLPGLRGYAEINRLPVQNPQFPLVVVMFRTEKEFQRYRHKPNGPDDVVAYYDVLSNRVILYEQSRLAKMQPDLAVKQAIATVAHEGVHQILHNIGVQQRLSVWPQWLSEGLAEFFAPTETGDRLHWKGAGKVNDLRMFELEKYLQSKAAKDPTGELVEHTVLAGQLTSTGYASAWALTHYLAKLRRTEFDDLLKAASSIKPLEGATDIAASGVVRSNSKQFTDLFGDDFKELERRLVLYLNTLRYSDPFENAPHFVATLVTEGAKRPKRSASTFQSLPLAQKWLRDTLSEAPAKKRNKAERAIRAFSTRTEAETYASQWLKAQ